MFQMWGRSGDGEYWEVGLIGGRINITSGHYVPKYILSFLITEKKKKKNLLTGSVVELNGYEWF